MTGPVKNKINDTAYKGIDNTKKVYASADELKDGIITAQEAQKYSGSASVFTTAKENGEKQIDEAIKNSKRLSQENQTNAKSVVQKYLGGVSFSSLLNNWSGFGEIICKAKILQDGEFEGDVQKKINALVDPRIKSRVESLSQQITTKYKAVLEKALIQAENELVGDKDIKNADGSIPNDGDGYAKLKDLIYKRPADEGKNGEHTEVSTFNSSVKDAKSSATQGYKSTVAYLEANGAKAKTKLVNGQEQTVYKIKDNQGTRYVTVDDAGQVHDLDKNKGFLRSSKFTTMDSIEDAKADAKAYEKANPNGPQGIHNVKVKVRNVDGQKQSVMTWRDNDGNKHSRVIDHNEETGTNSSTIVHKVNAGGRAKYSSDVSGLSALASKDPNDDIQFNDDKHRFQNGTWTDETGETHANNVITQHGRMNLDKANTNAALEKIRGDVLSAGGKYHLPDQNTVNITLNGHTYTIDKSDNVSANRKIRLIQGEINRLGKQENIFHLENETVDTKNIVEDDRADTNLAGSHTGEKWRVGSGNVEGVGVDSPQSHTPHAKGKGKVNSVRYGSNISRTQFAKEGWKASSGRTAENDILEKMDSEKIKGNEKSVRNLKTANEFAERFVKAMQAQHTELGGKKYNTEMLAKAIADANPSFFDSQGNMYKNADFSRLNLPKKLERYEQS